MAKISKCTCMAKMRPHFRGNCWQWTWTPAGTSEPLTCCCIVHSPHLLLYSAPGTSTFLSWQVFAPDPLLFSMIAFMLWPREQPNVSYTSLNVHYKSLPDSVLHSLQGHCVVEVPCLIILLYYGSSGKTKTALHKG